MKSCGFCLGLDSFPGHSQILSRSRGVKSGEGLVPINVTDRKLWTRLLRNVKKKTKKLKLMACIHFFPDKIVSTKMSYFC